MDIYRVECPRCGFISTYAKNQAGHKSPVCWNCSISAEDKIKGHYIDRVGVITRK